MKEIKQIKIVNVVIIYYKPLRFQINKTYLMEIQDQQPLLDIILIFLVLITTHKIQYYKIQILWKKKMI